jgi:DNA-binding CsgD family transcriptional regulator
MSLATSTARTMKHPWQSEDDKKAQALIDAVALASARRWAANEVGAAVAQQLVEPLTALMIYIQELKGCNAVKAGSTSHAMQELVDGAMRETERVCAIMQRLGNRSSGAASPEFAAGTGSDAIGWWAHDVDATGPATETAPAGHNTLTPREHEVLNLVSGGVTNKEGAQLLKISPRTFEAHRAQIMRKLGARNVADLLRKVLVEPR